MGSTEYIINQIITLTNQTAPDSEVYLFGSRARGEAKKMSDWDLLILLNSHSISFDYETKFMDEFYELELKTGEIFSPLIYTKEDWNDKYAITPFHETIQKEGVRIK
jgi:uncharacterized protein